MYTGYIFDFLIIHFFSRHIIRLTVQAKIADACHGALRDQTTNVLSCTDGLNICLTDVYYYQWHINDHSCPHTINKSVFPHCCRHDTERCFWAAPFEDVRALQKDCDRQVALQGGICELHSTAPRRIRPLCHVDNVVLSTTSSVRSIHYVCLSGRCRKLTTEYVGYRKVPTTRRETTTAGARLATKTTTVRSGKQKNTPRKNGSNEPSPPFTISETENGVNTGQENSDGASGNNTNKNSGVSPDEPGTVTTLPTARIVAIDQPKGSGVGNIIGGIVGGIVICLALLAAYFFRRWWKSQPHHPSRSNTVSPIVEHTYEEMGHTYVNTSVTHSLNSFGSLSSQDSGKSQHHYAAIDSFRRSTSRRSDPIIHRVSQRSSFLGGTGNFLRRTSAKSSREIVRAKAGTESDSSCVVPKRLHQSNKVTSGSNDVSRGASFASIAHQYDHVMIRQKSIPADHSNRDYDSQSCPIYVVGGVYDRLERDDLSTSSKSNIDSPYNTLTHTLKR